MKQENLRIKGVLPQRNITWHTKQTDRTAKNEHKPSLEGDHDHATLPRIVDASNATFGSSYLFSPLKKYSEEYTGGESTANNPSLLMYQELKDLCEEAVKAKKQTRFHHDVTDFLQADSDIETFVSIGISNDKIFRSDATRDSTKSILRHDGDLLDKMHSLIKRPEYDSLSPSETDELMKSLNIVSHYRFVTELSSSSSAWQDWPDKWRRELRESKLEYEQIECAKRLVHVKRERENTTKWPLFAGPLWLTRAQILAEGDLRLCQRIGSVALEVDDPDLLRLLCQERSSNKRLFLWRIPQFYDDLEASGNAGSFNDVQTINRICDDKYWACTCASFIYQCWGNQGMFILDLTLRICQDLADSEDGLFRQDDINRERFAINVTATKRCLVLDPVRSKALLDASSAASRNLDEFVDCFRWLICALMPKSHAQEERILSKGLFQVNVISLWPHGTSKTYVPVFKPFNLPQDGCRSWTNLFTDGLIMATSKRTPSFSQYHPQFR